MFRYVGPPVNTACLGAAGAFLRFGFDGFQRCCRAGHYRQRGPAVVSLVRLHGSAGHPGAVSAEAQTISRRARYGSAPPRTARRLLMPLGWIVLVLAGIPFMMRAEFNPNLLDLQSPSLQSVQLIRKLQTWEAVVLSRDLGILRKVREAVEQSPMCPARTAF